MFDGILRIRERKINKIMVPKNEVIALPYRATLDEALAAYQKHHYSRYPVYFNNLDQIVGVLHMKDIMTFWNDSRGLPVIEFVRLPHFVYEDHPALNVLLELQRLRLSLGIVIDEFGGISGIITVEDLIEEIVGDIEDEFDRKKKPMMEKVSENECYLDPRMQLDDFSERFGVALDETEVSSVGGLLLKLADRIPRVGEEIKYRNFLFTIVEGSRRKISKIKVRVL